jgi:hypothetical protein
MSAQGEISGGQGFSSEGDLVAELAAMSAECAPRRFTVCAVAPDQDDAAVVCWGMAFDDEVIAYLPAAEDSGRPSLLHLASPARLRRVFGPTADTRLVWIDP